MKNLKPLPTANKEWGFWGTSVRNGYDAELTWDAASRFLAKEFDLTAEQSRDVLDGRFGRHLADDLSIAKNEADIAKHLASRAADQGWRDCFESAITEITGKTFPRKARPAKDQLFTQIAQRYLGVETLVTRNADSLDFHDVSAASIKAALEAAYEAGRKEKR